MDISHLFSIWGSSTFSTECDACSESRSVNSEGIFIIQPTLGHGILKSQKFLSSEYLHFEHTWEWRRSRLANSGARKISGPPKRRRRGTVVETIQKHTQAPSGATLEAITRARQVPLLTELENLFVIVSTKVPRLRRLAATQDEEFCLTPVRQSLTLP